MATCIRTQFGFARHLQIHGTQQTQERRPDAAPVDQTHDSFLLMQGREDQDWGGQGQNLSCVPTQWTPEGINYLFREL